MFLDSKVFLLNFELVQKFLLMLLVYYMIPSLMHIDTKTLLHLNHLRHLQR
jgi:hypothetical protein